MTDPRVAAEAVPAFSPRRTAVVVAGTAAVACCPRASPRS